MLKGNLMIDAILGLMVMVCCVTFVSMFVQSAMKVDDMGLEVWQVEEDVCEIWCDSFWFYND